MKTMKISSAGEEIPHPDLMLWRDCPLCNTLKECLAEIYWNLACSDVPALWCLPTKKDRDDFYIAAIGLTSFLKERDLL
jgi:hypothetical protein